MSDQTASLERYRVFTVEPEGSAGTFILTFVPKGLMQERGCDGTPKRVPQFIVTATQHDGGFIFDWGRSPDDPGAMQDELELDAQNRLRARLNWIASISALVDQVEEWARELDWSTRRLEKKLDDSWVGRHRVPSLLMQADTCRILLEPVGRTAPGAEGIVDLYTMPAYDDIATLYYYDNRWNMHYAFTDAPAASTVREAPAIPLSKEALRNVLAEMKQHAA